MKEEKNMEEKNQNNQKNLKNEILKNLENNTEKEDILDLIYKAREEKIDDSTGAVLVISLLQ